MMGFYSCTYCGKDHKSEKAYNRHMVLEHEAFKNGDSISVSTYISLEKVSDRVLFLMRRYKGCCKPDNGDLWLKYLQFFTNALVYDVSSQDYVLNDNEAQQNHIKHKKLRWALAQLENVRRAAQKHRNNDKKFHMKDGTMLPHVCIAPTDEDQQKAIVSEQVHREWALR